MNYLTQIYAYFVKIVPVDMVAIALLFIFLNFDIILVLLMTIIMISLVSFIIIVNDSSHVVTKVLFRLVRMICWVRVGHF